MKVSLVIPGRDTESTIRACLSAVVPLQATGEIAEIIFVDDGSRDATRTVVREFPTVQCLLGRGRGAGAARNLGWRAAKGDVVWFLDSDCVAQPDALAKLLRHLDDPRVAAVGGTLSNATPHSLLACLVHEEIVERHLRMPLRVNFLATANVLYRHSVLVEMDGFDERFLKGQDAELAWRVKAAGYDLAFDTTACVGHHYHLRWRTYLRTQRQQGYWRAFLHTTHRGHSGGDSYSNLLDHLQPPLAMLMLLMGGIAALLAPLQAARNPAGMALLAAAALAMCLLLAQAPMVSRLVRRTQEWRYLAFGPFGWLRSIYRGIGVSQGAVALILRKRSGRDPHSAGNKA